MPREASEAYDSKISNPFTKLFCKEAFEVLEEAIVNEKHNLLPYGAMLSGIGFGNASTTLGHALSYVFSNEGIHTDTRYQHARQWLTSTQQVCIL